MNAFTLANEEDKGILESAGHLIRRYLDAREGLQKLRILRSERTLQGDFAEWLVVRLLDLQHSESSVEKGLDAKDSQGKTYQIKSRIVSDLSSRTSFDLGSPEFRFDYLVGVLFSPGFDVLGILRVPYDVVIKRGSQTSSTFRLYWKGMSSLDSCMERLIWSSEGAV